MMLDLQRLNDLIPSAWQGSFAGLETWQFVALFLVVLLGLLVRWLVIAVTAWQARMTMDRWGMEWGRDILARIDKPLGALAVAGLAAILLPNLYLPYRMEEILTLALRAFSAASGVWLLYRLVDLVSAWLEYRATKTETRLDDQLAPMVRTFLKVVVVALGVVFVLQNLDIDVGGLLAGLGLGGLAFALAAKDTVANLFGALTIFLDRPFQVADAISVAGVEGVVESVGFRSTKIRTFYNSIVTVPNSAIADSVIDNLGARRFRRSRVMLGLTYDTPPELMQAFVEGVRAILHAHPNVRSDSYEAHFNAFSASSLDVLVNFHLEVPDWSTELRSKHDIFLQVLRLAADLGVDFAYPTQTIHVEQQAQPGATPEARAIPRDLIAIINDFGPKGGRGHIESPTISSGFFAAKDDDGDA